MRVKTQFLFNAAAVMLAICCAGAPAHAAEYSGVPTQVASRDLHAKLDVDGSGLTRQLAIREYTEDATAPTRAYGVDMTKRMHLIIVSDNFDVFLHVHPILGADGRFRLPVRFPQPAVYHLFADAEPSGFGHSVFRFDVNINSAPMASVRQVRVPRDTVAAGPYSVRLSALRVAAGQDTPLLVAVTKGGEPANDLHPYLGAFAHIVALGVADLSYTHVHAMDAHAMAMGMDMNDRAAPLPADAIVPATMTVHLNLPKRGRYKVWVEFQGGNGHYVAPFVLTAN